MSEETAVTLQVRKLHASSAGKIAFLGYLIGESLLIVMMALGALIDVSFIDIELDGVRVAGWEGFSTFLLAAALPVLGDAVTCSIAVMVGTWI